MGKEGKLIEARPCPVGPSGTTLWPVCMRPLLASAHQEATPLLPGHVLLPSHVLPTPCPMQASRREWGRSAPQDTGTQEGVTDGKSRRK